MRHIFSTLCTYYTIIDVTSNFVAPIRYWFLILTLWSHSEVTQILFSRAYDNLLWLYVWRSPRQISGAPVVRQPAKKHAEITRKQARGFSRKHRETRAFSRARKFARPRRQINNRGREWYSFSEERFDQEEHKKPRQATGRTDYPFLVDSGDTKNCFRSWAESTAKLPPYTTKSAAPGASASQLSTQQWKLIPLHLTPPRLTQPPRDLLVTWDIRVRRLTFPF